MSPGVMRLIFGGFVITMVGVAVNALLLQPDVLPLLAKVGPITPSMPSNSSIPSLPSIPPAPTSRPASKPQLEPAAHRVASSASSLPARADVIVDTAAVSTTEPPMRVARLSIDSARPTRLPRLPDAEGDADIILRVQKELLARGYGPVVANGIIGPLSRAAIMAYEHDAALPITGEATDVLLRRMREGATASRTPTADSRKIRSPEAEQVVRTVQHSLTTLGFEPGRIDGRIGDETERAIRAFETTHSLQPTGRVSAELFSLLARAMGARSARATP